MSISRKPDWEISPGMIKTRASETIDKTKEKLDQIASISDGEESFNSLKTFQDTLSDFEDILGPLEFMKHISLDKERRDAATEVEKTADKFRNQIWVRKDLYQVFARLESSLDTLEGEDKLLLEKTLRDFRKNGAALPEDKRAEFLKISNELKELESEFQRTLNEVKDKIPFAKEELDGVPSDIVDNLERDGDKYLATLDYPVFYPIIQFCKNSETRRRMYHAYLLRGGIENSKRLARALDLRQQRVSLLGYSNYADYMTEDRMAKTAKRVLDFLSDLRIKLTKLSDIEVPVLKELKAKELGKNPDEVKLESWDWMYLHEMLMREKYTVDQNEVKKYFPIERVIDGVLTIYQQVLGLRFEKPEKPNVWHDEVQEFLVYDKKSSKLYGTFFLDLYPREGKYKHYAVFTIMGSRKDDDGNRLHPIAAMVANFQKPTASQPSLLTHSDVESFFHEFGHLMHDILADNRYGRFGLIGVLWDFVETPSQMLENWAWKKESLSILSSHFKDPEKKLPDEILHKMFEAKLLNSGIKNLRQVFFGTIDMTYHTKKVDNLTETWHRLYEEITDFPALRDTYPEAGFGHIMAGYSAAYYSYLWSKVFAEDMFTRFEEEGLMNSEVGIEYRDKVLVPAGSKDPDEIVRDFLGREANNQAFLKSLGLES